ncbi:MAG: thiosulfate oxidation carrier protein SoxY [Gammaproteobacteria bacterium]|nr:thiosulfate oxidation carrier protein SoxY [Gammaproteobacteria bacterium]
MLNRRSFLMRTIAVSAGALLLQPLRAMAAWNEKAFKATDLNSAMTELLGGADAEASDAIQLSAPDIAENGAVVQVSVATDMADVESISLYVEKNPSPLAAQFNMSEGMSADVTTRIKMRSTSNLIAVVKAGGKLYSTQKEVKVTIGGCGG